MANGLSVASRMAPPAVWRRDTGGPGGILDELGVPLLPDVPDVGDEAAAPPDEGDGLTDAVEDALLQLVTARKNARPHPTQAARNR
ncbi:hypothetical protein ABIB25_002324 [Nakamurella sp. UYEF19]|uniref:hypothetical protein n=1 Tax=Nakamurella sp. UYEF19 TaxID=1756392 RepID=UPI003393209E